MLLIEDGHGSHITLDIVELARTNDIHLLCLPSHTSHILQPLDTGAFKSFKSGYSKACRKYIMVSPGRVITSEVIASLVADPGHILSHQLIFLVVLRRVESYH